MLFWLRPATLTHSKEVLASMANFFPSTKLWQAVTLWAVLMVLAPNVSAQQYLFQHYSERDGLINNAVNGMTQGDDGRLWFATRGGVMTYDGHEWVRHGLDQGLKEKEYSHITKGPDGKIWIVSKRIPFRVQFFDGTNWQELPKIPFPYLNTHCGLFVVTEFTDGSPLICVGLNTGHLAFWLKGEWHLLEDLELTEGTLAYDFVEGRLQVATHKHVLSIDPVSLEIFRDPMPFLPEGQVFAMTTDPANGQRWFVGQDWIGRLLDGQFSILASDLSLVLAQEWGRTNALVDSSGGLFFGGLSQAFLFDPVFGLEELNRSTGRETSGATDFFQDSEGIIWVASLRGVSKLVSRRFTGLDRSQGLFRDEVSAVMEDSKGRIILGHEGGLTFLDPDPVPFSFNLEAGVMCRVMDLAEDSRGNLWVATDGHGLARVDADRNIRWFGHQEGVRPRVFAVLIDQQDQISLGVVKGFFQGDGEVFHNIPLPLADRNMPSFVRRLYRASDGSIYLATGQDGVIRYDKGQVQHWMGPDMITGNSTFAIHETSDHRFWIGTSVGLYFLTDDSLFPTVFPDPVIDRPVYSILSDGEGRVWFGTDKGVFIWDGIHLQNYSVDDGLIGSEINRDGFELDSKGQFWVGTDRGVSIYRSDLDLPRQSLPRLEIEGFDVDGQWFAADYPLQLNSPPRSLFVHFKGISFTDEGHMGFRTWLENYEPDWSDLSPLPISQVRYTNLPAGDYRFHVQVENSDGLASEVVISPEINIEPALRDRWWLSALGLLIVTVVGFGLISFWEGRRYARRLEGEVLARTNDLEVSEQVLRLESQRLSATLGSILDGVLALDEANKVVLCNLAAEKILNRSAEEIISLPFREVLPLVGDRVGAEDIDSGELQCQDRIECAERGTICLEVSSSPVTDEAGKRTGSVVAFRDITDRLRLERELIRSQKLESLGLLAGGIAHDFNNLLTIMMGNIDLVENGRDLAELDRESLELAKQASSRARTLTEQLLTFARGGAPRQRISSLHEIVDQSVALSFSGLNVSCQVKIPDDLWLANVDPGQLSQVFNNLLINAAQAMPEGGLVLVVGRNLESPPQLQEEGQWVRIDVIDTGSGISEKNLARIFDPYFTTKSKGSGLGLATSYSIITRHGGRILVESKVGEGSTFSIFLPRGHGVLPEIIEVPEMIAIRGGRVLVLEDEEGIHHVLKGFLARLGLEATFTSFGEETVARYEAGLAIGEPFDLVMTDLTIPGGLGGRATMALLMEIDPEVKAVVISGYSHEEVMANYGEYGFLGALRKPFEFVEFARVLGEVLGEGL